MSLTSSSEENSVAPIAIHFRDSTVLWTVFDIGQGRHKVVCDICGQTIYLNENANTRPIVLHRGSNKCLDYANRQKRAAEREKTAQIRASIGSEGVPRTPVATVAAAAVAEMAAVPDGPSVKSPLYRQLPHPWTPTPSASPLSSTPISLQNSPLLPATPLTASCSTAPSPGPGWPQSVPTSSHSPTRGEHESDVQDLCSSIAGTPSSLTLRAQECRGISVEWTPGSVWKTYPYHRHAPDSERLPWEPVALENDRWLRIRSEDCVGRVAGGDEACPMCTSIPGSARFQVFMNRAKSAADHTPWYYLTREQLDHVLRKTTGKYRQLRLKVCAEYLARRQKLMLFTTLTVSECGEEAVNPATEDQ